jgi:hypothetical protein
MCYQVFQFMGESIASTMEFVRLWKEDAEPAEDDSQGVEKAFHGERLSAKPTSLLLVMDTSLLLSRRRYRPQAGQRYPRFEAGKA